MKRLFLLLLPLFAFLPFAMADEGEEIDFSQYPPVVIADAELGQQYHTSRFSSFSATLRVTKSGILRVMSNSSDFPLPYSDRLHADLLPFVSSFYEGAQGYVLNVSEGDVIYFYRSFCMADSRVWFEMTDAVLTYAAQPAVGERLLPTGSAQFALVFNMPVSTSGGTISCCDHEVSIPAQSGNLYIICDVKSIIMDWIAAGLPAGSDITVRLNDVCATIDSSVKCSEGSTITLHYLLPEAPGRLLATNFEDITFKSYWLADDEEGVLRMTFSRPVSTTSPGYLSLVYGDQNSGDIASIELPGRPEGHDLVFDLREQYWRPSDFLESKSVYTTIMLRPGGVCDDMGDLMYSEGAGTVASWTFELPYQYLTGVPRWEVTGEDESDIDTLEPSSVVWLYVYNYNLVRADGILLSFDSGAECVRVPFEEVEVEYEKNGKDALLVFSMPELGTGNYRSVNISFDHLRVITGDEPPVLSETFPCYYSVATAICHATSADGSAVRYDLAGRRLSAPRRAVAIVGGKKVSER